MSDVNVLVRATVRTSLRRQRSLLALMVIFVSVVLVCNGVVGAGVAKYARSVQYQSALNLIELSSASSAARREISTETLREVRDIPGVTGVYPWTQVDLSISNPSDWPDPQTNPGALWATPVVPGLGPQIVLGSFPATGLSGGQIALPRSVPGGVLDNLLGKIIVLEYTKVLGSGRGEPARKSFMVVAIFDNSTPGEAGPTPSYIADADLTSIIRESGAVDGDMTYTTAYVQTAGPGDVPRVQTALATRGFAVSSVATQLRSLGGLFNVLSWASWIFGVLLILVCLGIGGAIGSAWVQQRTREIGLLKAIGWSRSRITSALMLELGLVGLVAAAIGTIVGIIGSATTTAVVASQQIELLPVDPWGLPEPVILLLSLALVPLCVCLGGVRSALRAVNIDADNALRDL